MNQINGTLDEKGHGEDTKVREGKSECKEQGGEVF